MVPVTALSVGKVIPRYTHRDRRRELFVNKGGTTSFRALVLLDGEALFSFI